MWHNGSQFLNEAGLSVSHPFVRRQSADYTAIRYGTMPGEIPTERKKKRSKSSTRKPPESMEKTMKERAREMINRLAEGDTKDRPGDLEGRYSLGDTPSYDTGSATRGQAELTNTGAGAGQRWGQQNRNSDSPGGTAPNVTGDVSTGEADRAATAARCDAIDAGVKAQLEGDPAAMEKMLSSLGIVPPTKSVQLDQTKSGAPAMTVGVKAGAK